MRRTPKEAAVGEIDLVPLIDCVFLILLFFLLCGRLSNDQRPEQITVPPARSVQKSPGVMERVVISMRGGEVPAIRFGSDPQWIDLRAGWSAVDRRLDAIWNRAAKRQIDGQQVAEAVLELRADGDAPYNLIQILQQIASGSIDAQSLMPRAGGRAFRHLDFAAMPLG
jgi:biopolymer transport protein ExbD